MGAPGNALGATGFSFRIRMCGLGTLVLRGMRIGWFLDLLDTGIEGVGVAVHSASATCGIAAIAGKVGSDA